MKLPHNFRKKRLAVSILILVIACAILYPYLSTRRRGILRRFRDLNEVSAASVTKSGVMAVAIIEKGRELNIPETSELIASLEKLLQELRTAISEMPNDAAELTPEVKEIKKELDAALSAILINAAKEH